MRLVFAALLALVFTQSLSAASRIIAVRAGASAAGADGTSWAKAFPELHQALAAVDALNPAASQTNPVEIWVTAGTYKPSTAGLSDPRKATFQLKSWVAIVGGFDPDHPEAATSLPGRTANRTILSGDIGAPQGFIVPNNSSLIATAAMPDPSDPGFADNVYNVVTATNTQASTLVNCIIAGGYASDSQYTDTDLEAMGLEADADKGTRPAARLMAKTVSGGGLHLEGTGRGAAFLNVYLSACSVIQNYSRGYGGGIASISARFTASDTVFACNAANFNGGAFFGRDQIYAFEQCDFQRNTARGFGGAISSESDADAPPEWKNSYSGTVFGADAKAFRTATGALISASKIGPKLVATYQSLSGGWLIKGMKSAVANLPNPFRTSTPTNKVTAVGRVGATYALITMAISVIDIGVMISQSTGHEDEFTKFWSQEFSPIFNTYCTPQGLLTLALTKLTEFIAHEQGSDKPTFGSMRSAYGGLVNYDDFSVIVASSLSGNFAGLDGGAVHALHENVWSEINVFTGNDTEGEGGAIAVRAYNRFWAYSTVFYANTAQGHSAVSLAHMSQTRLTNCTIVNNVSRTDGHAIDVEAGAELHLINSVLWGNTNADPDNFAGGADIATAKKSNLEAESLKTFNADPSTSFFQIGITDITSCDIQSLGKLTNDWTSRDVMLFPRGGTYSDRQISAIVESANAADRYSIHDILGWYVKSDGGDRIANRNNISVDPKFHSGWRIGNNSPLLGAGDRDLHDNELLAPLGWNDVLYQRRVSGAGISIGAVESPSFPVTSDAPSAPGRIFVKPTSSGNGSGNSWNNATSDLKGALAQTNAEVWVAAGTYYPSMTGDRAAAFTLGEGTRAYGGFSGTELDPDQRNLSTAITTLSGKINEISGTVRSAHVIALGTRTTVAYLDGFTITGGQSPDNGGGIVATNARLTLRNVTITGNTASFQGGGLYTSGSTFTQLVDCKITANSAEDVGGGAYISGRVLIDRCTLSNNHAGGYGGAALVMASSSEGAYVTNSVFANNDIPFVNAYSDLTQSGAVIAGNSYTSVKNCTFYNNQTGVGLRGGGYGFDPPGGGLMEIENCIFWKNGRGGTVRQDTQFAAATVGMSYRVNYSLIHGISNNLGSGNFTADPKFANEASANLRPTATSPTIDKGNGTVDPLRPLDNDGLARSAGTKIDIGAYEYQGADGAFVNSQLRVVRTFNGNGDLVYTITVTPSANLPGTLTYSWTVNRGDGQGFVALPAGFGISGQSTGTLVITQPPPEMDGWTFHVEVTSTALVGTASSVAFTGIRGNRIYVNAAATGAKNGVTWADAYTTIEDAIAGAQDYSEIWVAQGTYRPGSTYSVRNQYLLRPGLALYGGFKGTETSRTQRNPSLYPAVVLGSYAAPARTENTVNYLLGYITSGYDTSLPCIIDGFQLSDAIYAVSSTGGSNGNIIFSNCTIQNALGAGLWVNDHSTMTLNNVTIARAQKGALRADNATLTVDHCLIAQNNGSSGAALTTYTSTVIVRDSTLADNSADYSPSGIYVGTGGILTLQRSIVWGNRDRGTTDATADLERTQLQTSFGGVINASNSIIQGTRTGTTYNVSGNIGEHPLFLDPSSLKYSLLPQSPAIALSAGAFPYVGTAATALHFRSLPSSSAFVTNVPAITYSAKWDANFTSYALSWQVDLGQGWKTPQEYGLTATTANTSTGATITLSKPSATTLPTFSIRAIAPGNVALPSARLQVTAPVTRYVRAGAPANGNGTSWATAYNSLRSALAAVSSGTELWVAAGTYNETLRVSGKLVGVELKQGVALYGGFAGTETLFSQRSLSVANTATIIGNLNANPSYSSFGQQVVLDGLTIIGAGTLPAADDRGFVIAESGSDALSVGEAGGVYRNLTISHTAGAGVHAHFAAATFESCTFKDAKMTAVTATGSVLRFIGCTFTNNQTASSGGAGGIDTNDGSLFIDGCVFADNRQGAVYVGGAGTNSSLVVLNSLFIRNKSYRGAAIATGAPTTVRNSTFADNQSDSNSCFVVFPTTVDVANSIFWGNRAFGSFVTGSLETQQIAPNSGGATITVRSSIVEGLSAYAGNNNLGYNPLFTTGYTLHPSSPAIDHASNQLLDDISSISSYANRLSGTTLDMGAYEFTGTPTTPVLLTSSPAATAVYVGAAPAFTVTGSAGTVAGLVWERLVSGSWVTVSGSEWQTASTSATATLTLTAATAANAGDYRYRIPSLNFTSPTFPVTVKSRTVVYVDGNRVAASGNGSSWATAFKTLPEAIASAPSALEIRMAAGTYTIGSVINYKPAMLILGGFPANLSVTDPALRNPAANEVRIVGSDLFVLDGRNNDMDTSTAFDGVSLESSRIGFTIINGASPLFRRCKFTHIDRTGMDVQFASSVLMEDCTFVDNVLTVVRLGSSSVGRIVRGTATGNINTFATVDAGATLSIEDSLFTLNGVIDSTYSTPITVRDANLNVIRSRFLTNTAIFLISSGGDSTTQIFDSIFARNNSGIVNVNGGKLVFRQATIVDNYQEGQVGISIASGSTLEARNSIFWGHRVTGRGIFIPQPEGQQIKMEGAWTMTNSTIEGLSTFATEATNSGYHPLFVDASVNNYALVAASPAVNTGNASYTSPFDVTGAARTGTPDRGAYEFTGTPLTPVTLLALPQSVSTYIGNTASFTVSGLAGLGSTIQWWRWDGTQRVALPADARLVVTTTSTGSTLEVRNVAATEPGGWVFTISGTTYQSPVLTITPVVRNIIYVDAAIARVKPQDQLDGKTWDTAYSRLDLALTKAPAGSEIWVMRGSYGVSDATSLVLRISGRQIYGGFTTKATDRSQRSADPGLTVFYGPITTILSITDTLFDGFTFTQGGLTSTANSRLNFNNCVVTRSLQGGIAVIGNSTLTLENSVVQSSYLEAVYVGETATFVANNSIFDGNGKNTARGTLTASGTSSAIFNGCTIRNEGGIYFGTTMAVSGGAQVVVNRSRIYNTITQNVVRVSDAGSNFVFRNSLFYDNRSQNAPFSVVGATASIIQSTFDFNQSDWESGNAVVSGGGTLTIKNSILWGGRSIRSAIYDALTVEQQQARVYGTGTLTVDHSIIQGFTSTPGTGNFGSLPLFTDELNRDFSLQATSPAIGAGDTTLSHTLYPLDYAGGARVVSSAADIGAYEFSGTVSSPVNVIAVPVPTTVASGNNAQFSVRASAGAGGAQFIWEVETSPGVFAALPSDGTYTVTVNGDISTLTINAAPANLDGKRFRFRLSGSPIGAAPVTLTVRNTRVIYVNVAATATPADGTTWDKAYRTLPEALANWTLGAELWVSNATYTLTSTITPLEAMRIYGGFNGTETTRDERVATARTVLARSTSGTTIIDFPASGAFSRNTVIDSFSFQGSATTQSGITCNTASPTITNCGFQNFSVREAIVLNTQSNPLIQRCAFRYNTAGSIFAQSSTTEILSSRFEDLARNTNGATGQTGSAIFFNGNRTGSEQSIVRDSVFLHSSEGVLRIENGTDALFERCAFLDNTATASSVVATTTGTTVEFRHSLIARNTNTSSRGVINNNGSLKLVNVTLANNTIAYWSNHAGALENNGTLVVDNSILWGNRATGASGLVTTEQHQIYSPSGITPIFHTSIIEGLSAYTGNANTAFDPLFDTRTGYEFQLTAVSPAIDSGSNATAQLPGTDLAGNNRQYGTVVDVGAYEYSSAPSSTTVALALANSTDANSRVLRTWVGLPGSVTVNGTADTLAMLYWQMLVDGQWTDLPTDGTFTASVTGTTATLTVTTASDTIADRTVRFSIAGSPYVSPSYTVTTRARIVYFRADAAGGGDGTSWDKAFNNLQTAIDLTPDHSELWLKSGLYGSTLDTTTFKRGQRVYGGFAGTESDRAQRSATARTQLRTIVAMNDTDASNSWDSIAFDLAGFTMTNSGGTFRNCAFNPYTLHEVTLNNTTQSVVMEACTIPSNGSGTHVTQNGGTLTVRSSTFAGLISSVILSNGGNLVVEDCAFTNSGGIELNGTTNAAIRRTTFTSVTGPLLATNVTGTLEVSDSTFDSCSSRGSGRAPINLTLVADFRLERSKVRTSYSGTVSVIYADSSTISVRNSYFAENTTGTASYGARFINSTTSIVGLTAVNNLRFSFEGGSATVANSLIWNATATFQIEANEIVASNGAVMNVHHSLIRGLNTYAGGTGNIGYNPRLTFANGYWVLGSESPARNAGDSSLVVTDEKDFYGNARLVGAAVDIGAAENQTADELAAARVLDINVTRSVVGAYLEITHATTIGGLVWQINTGSGWVTLSAGQIDSDTTTASTRALRLKWNIALQGARVRLFSSNYTSPEITLDFGASTGVNGSVLAITPTPDSRAASTKPTISASLSHAYAAGTLTDDKFVVHGSQRGRLTTASGKRGTLTTDVGNPTLTPGVTFAAGEVIEVTLARSLATALGGTFTPYVSRFSIPWSSRAGSFRQGASLSSVVTGTITGVAAGDLNNDGRTDLMFAGDSSAWIYLGNGVGGFTQLPLGLAGGWTAFAIADFDGNGRIDFAGSRSGTSLFVSTISADSTTTQPLTAALPYAGTRLLAGDFNGDGKQDLLVLGDSNAGVDGELLLLNTGASFVPASTQRFGSTERTREALVADLNHDGALDFVQVGATTGDITVWLNDGNGVFTTTATIRVAGTQTIALTDVDGDGWTDLVIAGGTGVDTLHIWRNDRTGKLEHIRSLQAGPIVQLAAADFDGDGDNDIVTISGTAPDKLWLNDGKGAFTATDLGWTSSGATAAAQLAVADLNNDGAPDLVLPQGARPIFWMPGIYFPGFAVTMLEGDTKAFAASDFTSPIVTNLGYIFSGFQVTALPTKGVLKLNGTAVTLNQNLSLADLSGLTFVSTKNLYGDDFFLLAPRDAGGVSPTGRVSLNITRVVDKPVVTDQVISAVAQVPRTITLLAVHPENEGMTYSIPVQPAHGTLATTSVAGTYTYTAAAGYLGSDSFSFTVSDAFANNVPGTVQITVADNRLTVTSAADSGAGTLRAHLATAAAQGGAWRIDFNASLANATINLSTLGDTALGKSAFLITNDITIDGTNAPGLIIRRDPAVDELRHFRVASTGRLVLKKLILRGGRTRGAPARGGAIYSAGAVELTNVQVDFNEALGTTATDIAEGGAIYGTGISFDTTDSVFASNSANGILNPGSGGAIYLLHGNSRIKSASFSNNTAPTKGADVLLASTTARSTSRWETTTVPGLAIQTSNGQLDIVARESTLPATMEAYVARIAPQSITGYNVVVPVSMTGLYNLLRLSDGAFPPNWIGVRSAGTLEAPTADGIIFIPPVNTNASLTLRIQALGASGMTYTEEFVASVSVANSAPPTGGVQSVVARAGEAVDITLVGQVAASETATYTITDFPAKGVLTNGVTQITGSNLTTARTVSYTAAANASGTDQFYYIVRDSRNRGALGRVDISVRPTSYAVTTIQEFIDALKVAQSTPGNVTITLSSDLAGKSIPLNSIGTTVPNLGPTIASVEGNLTIDGTAAPGVILEQNLGSRLFYVAPGASLVLRNLTLSGGTISSASGLPNGGAGIYNRGSVQLESVTVRDCIVHNASGSFGAGLMNDGGTVTMTDTVLANNRIFRDGAGGGDGHAIHSINGAVSLTRVTFTQTLPELYGISFVSYSATSGASSLTLNDSTVPSLLTATSGTGALTINAGTSSVAGPGLFSIGALDSVSIYGVATIPLTLTNGPATSLTATSLNTTTLPNSWITLPGTLAAPKVKILTSSPTLGATPKVRVTATSGAITFNRDIPVTLSARVTPLALPQTVIVATSTPTDITLTATVPALVTPSFTIVASPQHGNLTGTGATRRYTPVTNYVGTDSFTFRVTDDNGVQSAPATVSITVTAQGAPFFENAGSNTVGAKGLVLDVYIAGNHSAGFTEAQALQYEVVAGQGQARGTAVAEVVNIGDATNPYFIAYVHYTPATNGVFSDTFTVLIRDQYGQTATAVYNVYMMDPALNTPPTITGMTLAPTKIAISSTTTAQPFATASVIDPESPPQNVSVTVMAPDATKGELTNVDFSDGVFPTLDGYEDHTDPDTGEIISTPINYRFFFTGTPASVTAKLRKIGYRTLSSRTLAPGYTEDIPLTLNVADDFTVYGAEPTYHLTLRMTVPAQSPVALASSVTALINTPKTFTLAASHPDGLALTYSFQSTPLRGTLSGTAPNLTYTPNAGVFGSDSFVYRVTDSTGNFATATVSIFINRPPVAADDALSRPTGQVAKISTVTLLANDSDPDGDALTFVSAAATSTLGVTVNVIDGWVYYAPSAAITANDSITYTVRDARGATSTGTLRITVEAPPPSTRTNLSITARTGVGETGVALSYAGIAGRSYTIQVSTDLVTWTTLATATANSLGVYTVNDPDAPPDGAGRFYRAVRNE